MKRSHGGDYPADWDKIARACKDVAGWKCVRCGIGHGHGHVLTVHHLDMNPANCEWWNLAALCQQCHLHIQGKVVMSQPYIYEHSEWFKPFVAGYEANRHNLPTDRNYVMTHLDELLEFGKVQEAK